VADPRSRPGRARVCIHWSLAALALVALVGCNSGPPPRVTRPELPPVDAPDALRGTLLTQVTFNGVEPSLVGGIGFVVGLAGTGGEPLDERVAATLERQMGLMGVGETGAWEGTPLEGVSPRQLLSDPNTAAVVVTAAIPPGAPEGREFDVFVRALNASSLEGGRLWTTELRIGPPRTFGETTRRLIGEAKGDIFINPFATQGAEDIARQRTIGRVLGGGTVTDPLQIEVRLRNPSHARARLIVNTINSRFPQRAGDLEPTAKGRNDQSIALRVPYRFRDRPARFLQLVQHLQMDASFPEVHARRYVEALKSQPELADSLSWALQAIGDDALPFVRELYDSDDQITQVTALEVGAGLGDALAARHLKPMAASGPTSLRTRAITLLGRLDAGPSIDIALREQAAADELTVRVAAYEALAERAERSQRSRLAYANEESLLSQTGRVPLRRIDRLAEMRLPAGTIHGVSRLPIGDKFTLDRVPYGDPLIYVTQHGQPRIVLFGEKLTLERPAFVSAWDRRLLLAAEDDSGPIRVRYETRPIALPRFGGEPRSRTYQHTVSENVVDLIDLLARDPSPESPEPGLDMSYPEVVGALSALHEDGAVNAAFATEQDQLVARILAAAGGGEITMRPEDESEEGRVVLSADELAGDAAENTALEPGSTASLVVPIERGEQGEGENRRRRRPR